VVFEGPHGIPEVGTIGGNLAAHALAVTAGAMALDTGVDDGESGNRREISWWP